MRAGCKDAEKPLGTSDFVNLSPRGAQLQVFESGDRFIKEGTLI